VRRVISSSIVGAAISLIAFGSIGAKTQAVDIRFDPDKPNKKSATIWLAYLVSRAAFHDEHKLPIPAAGEIVPTFEEEVHARKTTAQTYQELKAKDRDLGDPYWEALCDVNRRGFMPDYVWTFLRRPQWPSTARPANLAAFDAWKREALPKHKPQTYGRLEAGKP
jgi:hypothetical protein